MHKLITGIVYPAQNLDDGTSIVFADAQDHLPRIWGCALYAVMRKSTDDKWINNGFTKSKNIKLGWPQGIGQPVTYNPCYNLSSKNSFIFNI